MDIIESLKMNLKVKQLEINGEISNLLNEIARIDNIYTIISRGDIKEVDLNLLKQILEKVEIDERDIFIKFSSFLKEISMDDDRLEDAENQLSKDEMLEIILENFGELQSRASSEDEIELRAMNEFSEVLLDIIESLYKKEAQRLVERGTYEKISTLLEEYKEVDEINKLLDDNKERYLTVEEKEKVLDWIKKSNLPNKIDLFILLGTEWIEKTRKLQVNLEKINNLPKKGKLLQEEQSQAVEEIPHEDEKIQPVEKIDLESNSIKLHYGIVDMFTKEEWLKCFRNSISRIKHNSFLNSEEKELILFILNNIKNILINDNDNKLYEELEEYRTIFKEEGINKDSFKKFIEIEEITVALILCLIPKLNSKDSPEYLIIEEILLKYKKYYLSEEEKEIEKEYIKNKLSSTFKDDEIPNEEERKKFNQTAELLNEFLGEVDSLVKYFEFNLQEQDKEKYLIVGKNDVDVIENLFIKIIKDILIEIQNLLNDKIISREAFDKKMEEFKTWNDKFEQYKRNIPKSKYKYVHGNNSNQKLELEPDKNVMLFLMDTSSETTLFEQGINENGIGKSDKINPNYMSKLTTMIKNAHNADSTFSGVYRNFVEPIVEKTGSNGIFKATDSDNIVMIAGRELKRLSWGRSPRIPVIILDVPRENKEKIGISSNNTIILVLGAYEPDFSNETITYNKMIKDAKAEEKRIQQIVDLFKNPNAPKEELLKYIYESFGLLEKIENGELFENEEQKGGRRQ